MIMRLWLLTAFALISPAVQAMQLVHSERSLYRQVLIYEDQGTRCLCFTRNCAIGRQSCMELAHPQKLVFPYAHMMLGSLYLNPRPANVLILGLGGGSLPQALSGLLPQTAIDVVEIDPAVVKVARQYFRFSPGPGMRVFEEDGRTYVKRALRQGRSYDLIMLDAYDHEYIPEHLLTREFLQEVRQLLKPGGVVAANTFSSSRLYDNESVTYRAVFGNFYNLRSSNRIILARNGPLPSLDSIRQASAAFEAPFARLGFPASEVTALFSTATDWDESARVLTDQYSPANLLNSAR